MGWVMRLTMRSLRARAPGDELVCEGSYTVTQDDVDAGEVINVATVNAEDPEDNDVPEEDEVTTPVDQNPAISLDKAVTSAGPYGLGDAIDYEITATNTRSEERRV